MLSDKNYKILCLLFTIIIIAILIRAFTNQGKLWENEYYRYDDICYNYCFVPTSKECLECRMRATFGL